MRACVAFFLCVVAEAAMRISNPSNIFRTQVTNFNVDSDGERVVRAFTCCRRPLRTRAPKRAAVLPRRAFPLPPLA